MQQNFEIISFFSVTSYLRASVVQNKKYESKEIDCWLKEYWNTKTLRHRDTEKYIQVLKSYLSAAVWSLTNSD